MCKSKTVTRVQKEPSTDSNTESWLEIDHIQSVNGINCIDFYKAILLVQGQPIEFIIDTGSPVTIIPPIINSAELHKTTKSFVDVNKNPINFKGEAMVEVKKEKKQSNTSHINNCKQKNPTLAGCNSCLIPSVDQTLRRPEFGARPWDRYRTLIAS